jgi:hypothetical protein
MPTRFGSRVESLGEAAPPPSWEACLEGPEQAFRDFVRSLKTECRAVCGEPESSSRR